MTRVCLVTTGHLSTNPRLAKEADALEGAGYAVRVVACRFWAWAEAADAAFNERRWPVRTIAFGDLAHGVAGSWIRVRHRLARELSLQIGPTRVPGVALRRAAHYVTPELSQAAAAQPADLYIAHNLGALPAAAAAAQQYGTRLQFDAEDFHRGELQPNDPGRPLIEALEARYIPRCDAVTAASPGIARAYADALGIPLPTTILNVFPRSDLEVAVDPLELAAEVPPGARSLHWFSQTIGPHRGLEDAVAALPLLPNDMVLSLRGGWAPGYERDLRALADRLGVEPRLQVLGHCPPDQVVRRAAEHDVGLALEVGRTENRDVCVTNKAFTYLLAGLPVVATSTTGQRDVCRALPQATRLYDAGDPEGLARVLDDLLKDDGARAAAEQAGRGRYTWDHEQDTFLSVVERVLEGRAR
ncbi:glycosyltransferase [Rubrivirga sp.]|uniref:glycosyltransferase n=1 Tax=Rubrivirga sp. TaxID=1885344 RepID=UPI003C73AD76